MMKYFKHVWLTYCDFENDGNPVFFAPDLRAPKTSYNYGLVAKPNYR